MTNEVNVVWGHDKDHFYPLGKETVNSFCSCCGSAHGYVKWTYEEGLPGILLNDTPFESLPDSPNLEKFEVDTPAGKLFVVIRTSFGDTDDDRDCFDDNYEDEEW